MGSKTCLECACLRANLHPGLQEYVSGFGVPGKEYWMGLENIHRVTSKFSYAVRFKLTALDGSQAEAIYSTFSLEGAEV